jgi:O-antigen/teichoic acid export membrane protein
VVWILTHGHGIVALALWELIAVLLGSSLLFYLTFRVYRELRIVLDLPSRSLLSKFWSYSSWVFLINICQQVIYYSDNLVVGSLLSVTAVTFYAIGGNLIEYMRQTVGALTSTFTPLASTLEAKGRHDRLQKLLIGGTTAALLVSLPIEVALLFRGETFIALWMGPQYAHTSGQVLKILLLGQVFVVANATSGGIAYGMEKHRPVALWALGEGFANLTLSILLAQRIGLYGVAWGTAIPNLVINILLWPRYICRLLEMPLGGYLWQSWGRSAIAVSGFAAACFWIDRSWPASGLAAFFLQIAAIFPIFIAGALAVFWKEFLEQFKRVGWWARESKVGVAEP